MVPRFGAALAAVCVVISSTISMPLAAAADETAHPVFQSDRPMGLHLEIAPDEFRDLQPAGAAFGGGPGGPDAQGRPPKRSSPAENKVRETVRNRFGTAFPWVQATLTVDGKIWKKIGMRYAGDGSYLAAGNNLKRPLRLEFTRFGGNEFHGLRALDLHSGTQDSSRVRETLAFALCRQAGIPAPRTGLAEVTLSVPGKYDQEPVGLYTIVEAVDPVFLNSRFGTDSGLLLTPSGMMGLEYLGDDWQRYIPRYQPLTPASSDQAARVMGLAKLLNTGTDAEFREQIAEFVETDLLLRYLAVNALLANADNFFAGTSSMLYLDSKTNRFQIIPVDFETSLGNNRLMGTPEQLLDMSLTHPISGENKLLQRLFSDETLAARYRAIVRELAGKLLVPDEFRQRLAAAERVVKDALDRETAATSARGETAGGGFFSGPGADLKSFVEPRLASIESQLSGSSKGYLPRFSFAPPTRRPEPPVDDSNIRELVTAPAGFEVTLFGAPPQIGYPVAISATPTGEVFIAVDEQGSLGRTPGHGKILRCLDTDGDGKADQVTTFATLEHPRGVVAVNGSVWVLNPPLLTVHHDDDGDGVADQHQTLVTGVTTDLIDKRGGDHTTNGLRLSLDGWIYIAVGDYGIKEARGTDGKTISHRGGGIIRVRPDGTDIEVYASGLRNPFDIAIDPLLNQFTRDNTNDGAGWDVRVSHLFQTSNYGYTQLYANFADETMPPLGQFGGGGGTGALYLHDESWPAGYGDTLYTGDWGRSEVYRHPLKPNGASFDLTQEVFLKIPRPTGMDFDGRGHLYVASWKGGEASTYIGPVVGFVARIAPTDSKPLPPVAVRELSLVELTGQLSVAGSPVRLLAQRELLRRGRSSEATRLLAASVENASLPLFGRVAALWTLKLLDGREATPALTKLTADPTLQEFALRALADRRDELAGVDPQLFVSALSASSLRVRAQAVIGLSRLNNISMARALLPQTMRPAGTVLPVRKPVHAQPDVDRVVPHLATRALISLNAIDACLEALDGPYRTGALQALRWMHDPRTVDGLIRKLGAATSVETRRELLSTLVRLYHQEPAYDGSWWGIRPDNTGPFYDLQDWEQSPRIGAVLTTALLDADAETATFLRAELARHQVSLPGVPGSDDLQPAVDERPTPLVIRKPDPNNPRQLGNLPYELAAEKALAAKGDAERGKALFVNQSCRSCHTDANGQTPKGPHLVDIGKRYKAAELVESILKPSAKLAQGYETYAFALTEGKVVSGFVVTESAQSVRIRDLQGLQTDLKKSQIDERVRQDKSAMPEGIVGALTAEELADLIAYLQSLE